MQQEVESAAVGLDATRLARLDRHFGRYVDDGRLAGYLVAVARHGRVAHLAVYGHRDREAGRPVEPDTIWRIQSMTKPITAVALLTLHEEGLLALTDPVSRYVPAFAEARVYAGGTGADVETRPAAEPVRVWHLLTHTAGLTYGFYHAHPVDALYRAAGFTSSRPPGMSLAEIAARYGGFPLLFEPGTSWNYSVSFDIVGRVIEVVSGRPLDEFLADRVFGPLGMEDTGFFVDEGRAGRLAALYGPDDAGLATPIAGRSPLHPPDCPSGGGGLLSTARDYHRFMEMLRRRGELDGVRLLGPRTVAYMTTNHLPGGADMRALVAPEGRAFVPAGVGYGLGVSVVTDPAATKVPSSVGEFGWAGAASTAFLVDPREDLTVQFMTQLDPISTHPILDELKQLVYQAIVD